MYIRYDAPVKGNTRHEANETFFVNLSGAANATIADAQGLRTILKDGQYRLLKPGG